MNREEELKNQLGRVNDNLVLDRASIESVTRQSEDGRINISEFKFRTRELYERVERNVNRKESIEAELKGIQLGRQLQKEEDSKDESSLINIQMKSHQLENTIKDVEIKGLKEEIQQLKEDLNCLSCGKPKANFCGKCMDKKIEENAKLKEEYEQKMKELKQ